MIKTLCAMLPLLLALAPCSAQVVDYSGRFAISGEGGTAILTLEQDEEGRVLGTLNDGMTKMSLVGMVDEEGIVGDARMPGSNDMAFAVHFATPEILHLALVPYGPNGEPALDQAVVLEMKPESTPQAQEENESTGKRVVFINRVRVDDAILSSLETRYGVPVQPGRYWYDAMCGAWGVEGGPTAGILIPGLPFPEPMPADISGGGTGVFINGREIHPLDRQGLVALFGQAPAGHYWLDAQGNIGEVGGPVIVNIVAAIQEAQQAQGGSVTHGYDSTYGARGTLAGGMYSGRTASGKSVFWYPGM